MRLIHVVAFISGLFFFIDVQFPMNMPQFIHSSVGKHLGCFQVLISLNKIAMSISVRLASWAYALISLTYIPRTGIPGSQGMHMFSFSGKCPSYLLGG